MFHLTTSGNMTLRPLVAVIGTTGVGKSQLAVSLARSLRDASGPSKSVILSADSMQLYKGLDVITNKVTAEEMGGVEHWGLDIVTPGQGGSWEVGKWCGEADKKVGTWLTTLTPAARGSRYAADHMRRNPLLHSALPLSSGRAIFRTGAKPIRPFRRPLEATSASSGRFFAPRPGALLDTFWQPQPAWPSQSTEHAGSSRPTTIDDQNLLSLHSLLAAVDPEEAGRWHWRDGRKVRRGLERWWERGGEAVTQGSSSGRRAR